jgi:hypothetical protein
MFLPGAGQGACAADGPAVRTPDAIVSATAIDDVLDLKTLIDGVSALFF